MFVWLNRVLSPISTHPLIGSGVRWHPTPVPKQTNTCRYSIPSFHKYLWGTEVFIETFSSLSSTRISIWRWINIGHLSERKQVFNGTCKYPKVPTCDRKCWQVPRSNLDACFYQLKWMETRLLLLVKICFSQFHWLSHFTCLAFSSNWQALAFIQTVSMAILAYSLLWWISLSFKTYYT